MINRTITKSILASLKLKKVLLLYGARQTGKTTLTKEIESTYDSKSVLYLNADESDVRHILENIENARSWENIVLGKSLLIIDEAQRVKDIGLKLKILQDNIKTCSVIATGSSSFDLKNKTSESLTGRKLSFMLYPFSFEELSEENGVFEEKRSLEDRLIYGSYPEIVTSRKEYRRVLLQNLCDSYLYRDVLSFEGIQKPQKITKLLEALAYQIGSQVSYTEVASLIGLDVKTVQKYIEILEQSFVIFRLPSFSKNDRNELKFSRKIYFYDTGVRNALLSKFSPLSERDDKGALFENYIVSEMIKKSSNHNLNSSFYFWRTKNKNEVDLIEKRDGEIKAYEFKFSSKKDVKVPLEFSKAYPNVSFNVITPENYDTLLLSKAF